jgi:hypothetical protein
MRKKIILILVFFGISLLYHTLFFSSIRISFRNSFFVPLFYSISTLPIIFIDIATDFPNEGKTRRRKYIVKYSFLFIISIIYTFALQQVIANSFIQYYLATPHFIYLLRAVFWALILIAVYKNFLDRKVKN